MALALARPGRVVERELAVWRRLWRASLFGTFLGPLLFLGAFGLGLGGLVDAQVGTVDGLPYLQFVAPGLLAATMMQSAVNESLWPVMAGMKWIGFSHGMAATELSSDDICIGSLLWVALRTSVAAVVFLVVAAALGGVASPWAPLAVPAAVLGALAFAAPLHGFTPTQESDARFALLLRLVIQPLFLFSGTVFPITQLPPVLQALAWLSPLWHSVALCRAATTGSFVAVEVAAHLAVLAAWIVGGTVWALRSYRRRLAT